MSIVMSIAVPVWRYWLSLPVMVRWGIGLGVVGVLLLVVLYPDRVLDACAVVGLLGAGTASASALRRRATPLPAESTEEIVRRVQREVGEAAEVEPGEPLQPTPLTRLGDETADWWRER